MILAIDPSSTCVGYALMCGLAPAQLYDGGLLRPKPAKLPLFQRVQQFAQDLQELLAENAPDAVVFEVSLTAHGRASDRGGAATLGIYGFAVGYLYHVLQATGIRLEAVIWTERVTKKKRTPRIAALYGRRYDNARDPGGDLADAIGIGRWWLARNPGKTASKMPTSPQTPQEPYRRHGSGNPRRNSCQADVKPRLPPGSLCAV